MVNLVAHDPVMNQYLKPEEIQQLMQVDRYVGFAPEHTRQLAQTIREQIYPRQ